MTAKELTDPDTEPPVTTVGAHENLASLDNVFGKVLAELFLEPPHYEVALELLAGEGVDMGSIPSDASEVGETDVHVDTVGPEPKVQPNLDSIGVGTPKRHAVHQELVFGD
jgi:hypothetical protein